MMPLYFSFHFGGTFFSNKRECATMIPYFSFHYDRTSNDFPSELLKMRKVLEDLVSAQLNYSLIASGIIVIISLLTIIRMVGFLDGGME